MADGIPDRLVDGIAVLSLPKALTTETCTSLEMTLTRVLADRGVHGVVLVGEGDSFSTGLSLDEKSLVPAGDVLIRVTRVMDLADKPIIAALSGPIVNEGIDLMISAHGRVALEGATMTMNVVNMAMLPGAGATQRLPRLIGAEASLRLMLSGETWDLNDTRLSGLVDRFVSEGLEDAAMEMARTVVPSPPKGMSDPASFQKAVNEARARHPQATQAQNDLATCVEAALLLPFEQGLAFEHARFAERCNDPKSRVLRHAAMAQHHAREDAILASATAQPVTRVVAMGRSSDAADLAAMALEHGHEVWIEAGSTQMGDAIADLTLKRLRPAYRSSGEAKARLRREETGEEMENADIIFDTAELTPDPPISLRDGAVWIVTSPDISASDRAREVLATGRTLRMRRLNRTSHLVELSAPEETTVAAIATAQTALSAGGQSVVMTSDVPGGLVGALFCAFARAAMVMLLSGKTPREIETAARQVGFRQGALQMIDALGAERSLAQMHRVYHHRGVSLAPLTLLSDRLAAVSDGDATLARRAVVFHVPAGQSFARDPDLGIWIKEWRESRPELTVAWPDVALSDAFLAALVSEAARLLQTETVMRASDIDLAVEKGLLIEARAGGPLIQADLKGVLGLSKVMKELEPVDRAVWAREPLIDDMVKNGRSFF